MFSSPASFFFFFEVWEHTIPWGCKESDMTEQLNWIEHIIETVLHIDCFPPFNASWRLCHCVCVLSCSVVSDSLRLHNQAPLSMELSRQDYWSGCHFLLQEIFATQGLNPHLLHLLHCRCSLYHWPTWEAIVVSVYKKASLFCSCSTFHCVYFPFCGWRN